MKKNELSKRMKATDAYIDRILPSMIELLEWAVPAIRKLEDEKEALQSRYDYLSGEVEAAHDTINTLQMKAAALEEARQDLWDRYDKMYDCIRALEKQNLLLSKALANLDERVTHELVEREVQS